MSKRWRWWAAAAVVVAVLAIAWSGRREPSRHVPEKSDAPVTAGERRVYDLEWSAHTRAQVAPAQSEVSGIDAETRITGEVAVEQLGANAAGSIEAVSYEALRDHAFRLAGQDVASDPEKTRAELVGKRVYVTRSQRGEVLGVSFDSDTSPATRTALRALVQAMQVTTSNDATWEAEEATSVGRMRMQYRRDGEALQRKAVALVALDAVSGPLDGTQALTGGAHIELAPTGRLAAMEDVEHWSYTRPGSSVAAIDTEFSFVLRMKAVSPFDARALQARVPRTMQALAEPVQDQDLARRRDLRLSQGITKEALLLAIDRFEKGMRPGGDMIVRAGAFLRLHPEANREIVARFRDPQATFKGRGFALDLLASAGDAPAQAAMREAIASEAARTHADDLGMYVQRFTLVAEPRPESATFLQQEYLRSRKDDQLPAAQGAAATLGAVVNKLDRGGDRDAASAAHDLLRAELRDATDPAMQRALLAGLGNAKRMEDVPEISALAGSTEPLVRAQVAGALRSMDSPEARQVLLGLAGDPDVSVATSVFASLKQQTLTLEDWEALAQVVRAGRTNPSADTILVELIRERRASAGASGTAILEALLARSMGADSDLGEVISQLLAQG